MITTEGECPGGCPGMLALHPFDLTMQIKILTPKQMFQRLSIAVPQEKAS